jgi:hypothetical protein
MADIYEVRDDRQGMNELVARFDNEEAANQCRDYVAAGDEAYEQFVTVEPIDIKSLLSDLKSTFDPDDL